MVTGFFSRMKKDRSDYRKKVEEGKCCQRGCDNDSASQHVRCSQHLCQNRELAKKRMNKDVFHVQM